VLIANIKFVLFGLILTLLLVFGCIHLGDWQFAKASLKQQLQANMDQRLKMQPVEMPSDLSNPESLRYLRVMIRGEYLAHSQRYLDNQVYQDKAGYHVLTPFRIKQSGQVILVNRGWMMKDFNQQTPVQSVVPEGEQIIQGYLWLPPNKTYRLGNASEDRSSSVIEVLQIAAISKQVGLPLLSVMLRLQTSDEASRLVVDWPRPDDRIATHLSYAYQWYGFAVSALLIFIVIAWRRRWKS